ncbi:MAG: exodeoxyribonuclease VII small subunit [Tissierellia bacterium]|nr:exodeoxyribonuclease VII small subunit [Tissierellia bacterium]
MDINKMSYEEAISKLETLIEELENEECPLEDSISKFRKGIHLYNHCNSILKKAEGEVKIILEDGTSSLSELDALRETENEYY